MNQIIKLLVTILILSTFLMCAKNHEGESYYSVKWNNSISKFNNDESDDLDDHITFDGKASSLIVITDEEKIDSTQTFSFSTLSVVHTIKASGQYVVCDFSEVHDKPSLLLSDKNIVFSIWLAEGANEAIYNSVVDKTTPSAKLEKREDSYSITANNIVMMRDDESTMGTMPKRVLLDLHNIYSRRNMEE